MFGAVLLLWEGFLSTHVTQSLPSTREAPMMNKSAFFSFDRGRRFFPFFGRHLAWSVSFSPLLPRLFSPVRKYISFFPQKDTAFPLPFFPQRRTTLSFAFFIASASNRARPFPPPLPPLILLLGRLFSFFFPMHSYLLSFSAIGEPHASPPSFNLIHSLLFLDGRRDRDLFFPQAEFQSPFSSKAGHQIFSHPIKTAMAFSFSLPILGRSL